MHIFLIEEEHIDISYGPKLLDINIILYGISYVHHLGSIEPTNFSKFSDKQSRSRIEIIE